MNEFLRKLLTKATALWAGWSARQRVIIAVVAVAVIATVITLLKISSTPVLVSVFSRPITDEATLDSIVYRIEGEGVKVTVTPTGVVQVQDEPTARRMRAILIRENLIPSGANPWEIFDRERWTLTDFERNVNFRRAQTRLITDHIKAIDDVDDASVIVEWPERTLFLSEQKPVTASVIVTPKPGSDILTNRKKVEGIQRTLKYAVEGLQDENITILDRFSGLQLNDFEGLKDFDRLSLIEKEEKHIRAMETYYRNTVLTALQKTYSLDRVRDLNIKFEKDMSKKSVELNEVLPTIMKAQTPGLPYDDSIRVESVVISETVAETKWKGTGINPEGPAGVEGQTPPAFKDMSNLYGEMTQTTRTHNEEISHRNTQEEKSPQIDRVTVSVNIDGKWEWKYDDKGNPVVLPNGSIERIYTSIPPEDLRRVEGWIRDAIGYNSARGDSVTVYNIAFDRTEEFKLEDAEYFRKKQLQTTIILFISGLTLLLFGFILFRVISREIERRRRLADEERALREQMMRESAMAEAEQEGMDVSISLEERDRMQLMEAAINMAKEHPEDAAQLIRTWLLEE